MPPSYGSLRAVQKRSYNRLLVTHDGVLLRPMVGLIIGLTELAQGTPS
nr:MAG TPA: hypothetical protein [Caudoviricetes sp.]